MPRGTRVNAAGRGCVTFAGWNDGYGKLVVIQHRLGMTSWYAHLARITVRRGRCVVAGNRVGLVGSTGHSTGPHLHFELRVRDATVDRSAARAALAGGQPAPRCDGASGPSTSGRPS